MIRQTLDILTALGYEPPRQQGVAPQGALSIEGSAGWLNQDSNARTVFTWLRAALTSATGADKGKAIKPETLAEKVGIQWSETGPVNGMAAQLPRLILIAHFMLLNQQKEASEQHPMIRFAQGIITHMNTNPAPPIEPVQPEAPASDKDAEIQDLREQLNVYDQRPPGPITLQRTYAPGTTQVFGQFSGQQATTNPFIHPHGEAKPAIDVYAFSSATSIASPAVIKKVASIFANEMMQIDLGVIYGYTQPNRGASALDMSVSNSTRPWTDRR